MHAALSEVFVGVFGKRLAATECVSECVSRSQAIQTGGAQELLGRPHDRFVFDARYLFLSDETDVLRETGTATLSNPRRNQPGRHPEWRLNYPGACSVMRRARAGDLIWIAKESTESRLLIVIAPAGSDVGVRLDRLFATGLLRSSADVFAPARSEQFSGGSVSGEALQSLDADDADLLGLLGVSVSTPNEGLLERLVVDLAEAPVSPVTGLAPVKQFAACVRAYLPEVDAHADPDEALEVWMATTTELFYLYEARVTQARVDETLANRSTIDLSTFLELAKSVLNARKARAGAAFEEHWSALLRTHGVRFTRTGRTRDRSVPDYLFPSLQLYEAGIHLDQVTFLGLKTTAKERWRQQVGEASDIHIKHFATMDRDLTTSTLITMKKHGVVPVLPCSLIDRHYQGRANGILTVRGFLGIVTSRQQELIRRGALSSGS